MYLKLIIRQQHLINMRDLSGSCVFGCTVCVCVNSAYDVKLMMFSSACVWLFEYVFFLSLSVLLEIGNAVLETMLQIRGVQWREIKAI